MSHHKERKEKDCLNCGTIVQGRYCQVCGQENIEPKETFWGMVVHFFNDITHFDGKFFVTVKDLLWRPGFLPAEYIKGRRASYLHPIRMYVFTSAIFFLIFFSLNKSEEVLSIKREAYTTKERESALRRVERKLKSNPADTNLLKQQRILLDTTKEVDDLDLEPYREDFVVSVGGQKYRSLQAYDSAQKSLPADQKDGFFQRMFSRKVIDINYKYRHTRDESFKVFTRIVLHKLPYLLFVSLPFFALILKLLYIRRKEFYYADHGIFSIYQYIFSFLLLLFMILVAQAKDATGLGIWDWLLFGGIVGGGVYLFVAMRRFYKQGRFKTFIKFLLLNLLGLIMLLVLFTIFALFSVFQL